MAAISELRERDRRATLKVEKGVFAGFVSQKKPHVSFTPLTSDHLIEPIKDTLHTQIYGQTSHTNA